jgi:hypothetical protein
VLRRALVAYAGQARYCANAIAQDKHGRLGHKDPNRAITSALDDAAMAERILAEIAQPSEPAACAHSEMVADSDSDLHCTACGHVEHQTIDEPVVTVNGDGEATVVTWRGETIWTCGKLSAPSLRKALVDANATIARLSETKVAVQSAYDLNREPLGSCNRCGRKYWKRETTGTFDSMVQPNGGICGGRFELNGSANNGA